MIPGEEGVGIPWGWDGVRKAGGKVRLVLDVNQNLERIGNVLFVIYEVQSHS